MNTLHFPWLEISVAIPFLGALLCTFGKSPRTIRTCAVGVAFLTVLSTTAAWFDFYTLQTAVAQDGWDLLDRWFSFRLFSLDELSAPLLPLTSLIYFLVILTTQQTKSRRFSFPWALVSLSITVATISSREPWSIVVFLLLGAVIPYFELKRRQKPTGVYAFHMLLFGGLLLLGQTLVHREGPIAVHSLLAIVPLMAAILIRSGAAPFHCWMSDLIEHATLGTWITFVMPMTGAYAALRLVLPIAPDWVLRWIALISLATAVYAVGMSLVQRDLRRFFCYLMLSQSSLVLVGLELSTPMGLTGALCVWLSLGLAMTGFGLIIRSLEARTGRLNLSSYHGLYDHVPGFGGCFLMMGLASVGFPGTFGFVALELLIEGASESGAAIGTIVVVASALCGIAIMHAYFRVFTGRQRHTSISLQGRFAERFAIVVLIVLIVAGGLVPQPGVATRHHAAFELLSHRNKELVIPIEGAEHDQTQTRPPLDTSHNRIDVPHGLE